MRECADPLWPCAMAGAVACLSGFRDVGVVIHGSSGCYYYPASILPGNIHGTQILEHEVIFGAEERILEVLTSLQGRYELLALVSTCVPAIVGEDMEAILRGMNAVIVDAPGFLGGMEKGYRRALDALEAKFDPEREGVNIDGLNPLDPFYRGNLVEAERLLGKAGVPIAARFCAGMVREIWRSSPYTLNLNPDHPSGTGECVGSLLGLEGTEEALVRLERIWPDAELSDIMDELMDASERIAYACDKYLKRHDPPVVAIYGTFACATAVAEWLEDLLDATIAFIGCRNAAGKSRFAIVECRSLEEAKESLERERPELVLGSSFERDLAGNAAFVPFTFPLRGRLHLRARPLAGIEGAVALFEDVLNALMDQSNKV